VAYALDASQPLGVDVQQLARAGPLIAAHWHGRLQGAQAAQAQAGHVPGHGGQATTALAGNAPQRLPLSAMQLELAHLFGAARRWGCDAVASCDHTALLRLRS
jgi:hypothetical protein